jgi:hypothetical protein
MNTTQVVVTNPYGELDDNVTKTMSSLQWGKRQCVVILDDQVASNNDKKAAM